MGEVYRAHDTRLGRDVAIKVLPSDLENDPSRKRRFEREARAIAALNHPNILSIYDIGPEYIVTELVEGEPLRHDNVTVRRAADIAAQIADGLAAAHQAGITHRDLKPDNVLLTRDGQLKILDFGLATVAPAEHLEGTCTMTEPGTVVGTPAYMSPEQVRGGNADHRSDIFSLGVLVYELLAGVRPFQGASTPEVMTSILREDPPELPDSVPAGLKHIVSRCLEKKPEQRFQSARDLAFALRALSGSTGAAKTAAAPSRRRWIVPITAAVAVGLAIGALLLTRGKSLDLSSFRYQPFATDAAPETNPAWSPDGKSIAYLKKIDRRYQLMVRALDAPMPVQLTRMPEGPLDDDGNRPFWSLDGDRIFFLGGRPTGLWSVAVAGGEPQNILPGFWIAAAALSPDGKTMAFWRWIRESDKVTSSLWISSPPGASPRKYQPASFQVNDRFTNSLLQFAPDGSQMALSIYGSQGPELWMLPWPDRGNARPRRLFPEMETRVPASFGWFPDSRTLALSLNGSLWIGDSRAGALERITAPPSANEGSISVSPDGGRIAFGISGEDEDIISVPLDGSQPRPIVATARNEFSPSWSRSGTMAYVTDRFGQQEIWLRSAQGEWERPVVTNKDFGDDNPLYSSVALSADGKRLAYLRSSGKTLGALWVSPATGGRPSGVSGLGYVSGVSWSPDGTSLAVLDGLRGQQIGVLRVGSNEPPRYLPSECASAPVWSPDGHWIACGVMKNSVILLVAPDGSQFRTLPSPVRPYSAEYLTVWSPDSATIYVASSISGHARLDAVDVQTSRTREIADLGPGIDFSTRISYCLYGSLAPDGKSFATTTNRSASDIWILDGFHIRKRSRFGW